MMEQIDRDVMRTHPDMHFFSGSDRTAQTHREVCFRSIPTVHSTAEYRLSPASLSAMLREHKRSTHSVQCIRAGRASLDKRGQQKHGHLLGPLLICATSDIRPCLANLATGPC